MTLVVLAAGMGSRYGGLKQLDPITENGSFIIDFTVYDAIKAGFDKVVFVIKRENYDLFKETIGARIEKHIKVEYAFQELTDLPKGYKSPEGRTKPFGTAHAVLAARDCIDDNFAVVNADDFYGRDAFMKLGAHLSRRDLTENGVSHCCMVGYGLKNTLTENGYVSRGVCMTDEKGMLTDITERTKIQWQDDRIVFTEDEGASWTELPRGTIVSMNFWGFTKSMMAEMEAGFPAFLDKALEENPMKGEYFLPGVVDRLIKEDKAEAKVLVSRDRWYGVTYKEDKQGVVDALQAMKDKGEYPDVLWK